MFTADGEVRAGGEDATPVGQAPASAPDAADPSSVVESEARPDAEPAADADAGPLPVDFPGFLMSLAAQGLQALMQQPPRLREARALVSILEMLEDKTRGRRTPEESDVLDTLLYQLRMGYLERQRAGGA